VLHGIDPFSISPENAASQGCRVFLLTRENHQSAPLQRVSRTNTANSPRVSEGPQELRYAFSDTEIPEEKQMTRLAYTVYSPKVR
jgi:hypothetical protein